MATFTVTAVDSKVRDWNSEAGGTMRAYKMKVQGTDGIEQTVEWSRKLSSPPPEMGQMLEGEIVQGQYGARFKKTQTAGGYLSRPEDPKRAARILRQHSQTTAIATMDQLDRFNLLGDDTPKTWAQYFELLGSLMDWFDRDAEKAGEKA